MRKKKQGCDMVSTAIALKERIGGRKWKKKETKELQSLKIGTELKHFYWFRERFKFRLSSKVLCESV